MSPYKISGTTVVSFSGGRTSAYMLRQVLDKKKGTPISRLPVDPSESIDGHSQRHGAKINPSPFLQKPLLPPPFKVSRYSGKDEVMPEETATRLNRAARDVIAERQRQVSVEDYSLDRDDLYVKGELADAGATYACLSGKPRSMALGRWDIQAKRRPAARHGQGCRPATCRD